MADTTQPTRFLDPASRVRAVTLTYPLAHDGREYRRIFIRRPTVADIAQWVDAKGDYGLNLYVDEGGVEIPSDVMNGLDPDDDDELQRVTRDFLPRRLIPALYPSEASSPNGSGPNIGDSTAPLSVA